MAVNARTVSDLEDVAPAPAIGAERALDAARQLMAARPELASVELSFAQPTLELFNRGLLDGGTWPTRLTWFVVAHGPRRAPVHLDRCPDR